MLDYFLFSLIFITALAFGFSNGLNDAANAVAAAIGSRAIRPRTALAIAAFFNLAGSVTGALTGALVAKTIGKGILTPDVLTYSVVIGAVLAAIIWTLVATYYGLPISVSHSLVAGLVGAGLSVDATINWGKFSRVLTAVVSAPLLGFIGAFVLMILLLWIFHRMRPDRLRIIFSNLQIPTTAFLAFAHGKNDGQMPIALMVMGLVLLKGNAGYWDDIPLYVILLASLSISLGTALGGWRVIKTVGFKVTTLRPIHGFASNISAASVIELASHVGIPVSTTHCSVSSVMGVGATKRLSTVRLGLTGDIFSAWILTFPICGALGWVLTKLLGLVI